MRRALPLTFSTLLFGLACGSNVDPAGGSSAATSGGGGPGGSGGQGQGGQAQGGDAGQAGGGGQGGASGCGSCSGDTPICVDGEACASACPEGRDACRASASASDPPVCCPGGQQCCEAQVFGYAGADVCRPEGEACPVGCPGGDVVCPLFEFCEADPVTGEYGCVPDCPSAQLCTSNLCCPQGAQCVSGACLLPDLTVDPEVLAGSLYFAKIDSASDPCLVGEQCLGGEGLRTVLAFTTRTMNVGEGDFVIGDPNGNPNFQWSACHQHFHYYDYADYRLLDASGRVALTGKKQGFAIIDIGQIDPNDPNTPDLPKYDGQTQGIQRGWYDEYSAGLPCQWIDVTGLPQGEYTLEVEVNPKQAIAEATYANNVASVPVTIPDPSCLAVDCTYLETDCMDGVCVAGQGCQAVPFNEGGGCEDGAFCTVSEVCQAGACVGGAPRDCALGSSCYLATCDEENDSCIAVPGNEGAPCDDQSPCTTGTTCSAGACTNGTPANEGMACDDGASCTSGTICTAGACGGGAGPVIYFADDFADASKGWFLGPEWQIGPAEASVGADISGDDPASDHTPTADNGIAGVQLGGMALEEQHGFYYLESPPFDTASAGGPVVLGFYRWLNTDLEPYMGNSVEVWNGTSWITVWISTGLELDAPAAGGPGWSYWQFELTAYKSAGMKVRFGFHVGQTVGLFSMGSWNIDDVLVASAACP